MNWELRLIALYFWVSECYEQGAGYHAQRMNKNTKNFVLDFTDQEAITVYLFGLFRKYTEVKDIHTLVQPLQSDFASMPYVKCGVRKRQHIFQRANGA